MNDIEEKLRRIINENMEVPIETEQLGIDDQLINYGVNSSNFVKIIVGIEQEFDIEFNDEALILDRTMSLREVINYVEEETRK